MTKQKHKATLPTSKAKVLKKVTLVADTKRSKKPKIEIANAVTTEAINRSLARIDIETMSAEEFKPQLKPNAKRVVVATIPDVSSRAFHSPFAIEDDVEKPEVSRPNVGSIYPFDVMAVGQSFLVPVDVDTSRYSDTEAMLALTEANKLTAARMQSAIRRYKERVRDGSKFSIRTVDEGVRVWRDK